MTMDEDRLLSVFRELNDAGVDYAVFGAIALGLHGLARATADLDLFIRPDPNNVERLKAALQRVFSDPHIEEITAADLCGEYPAVRYAPPDGFSFDILTRLGEAFQYSDLDVELKSYAGVPVRVRHAEDTLAHEKGHRSSDGSLRRGCSGRALRFSGGLSLPVQKFRSIEDMPRPWRMPDDPENLRVVARLLALHRILTGTVRTRAGVARYRSIEEAESDREDRFKG
jgi:hypothetical protein